MSINTIIGIVMPLLLISLSDAVKSSGVVILEAGDQKVTVSRTR